MTPPPGRRRPPGTGPADDLRGEPVYVAEFLPDPLDPVPGAGQSEEELRAGRGDGGPLARLARRRSVRVGAGAVLLVAALTAGGLTWRHHDSVRAAAVDAAAVAPVHAWIADDRTYGVNAISSAGAQDCRDVDPVHEAPPEEVALRALTSRLPGYARRGVIRTIDEAGHLCMLQVSVVRAAEIVVMRVEPPWGSPVRPTGSAATVDHDAAGETGFVAAAAPRGWTVAVGWSGPATQAPDRELLLTAANAEAAQW